MLLDGLDGLVKSLRRKPIFNPGGEATTPMTGCPQIQELIPHRDPFLLIDSIDDLDLPNRTIRGSRCIRKDDPVFAGHFPGKPVYPGVLQVEAMGQLALCLSRLTDEENGNSGHPPDVRAIKIHYASFLAPISPGDHLTIQAGIVEDNGFTAISSGQVFKDSTLCSCSVQEVCFVD